MPPSSGSSESNELAFVRAIFRGVFLSICCSPLFSRSSTAPTAPFHLFSFPSFRSLRRSVLPVFVLVPHILLCFHYY